MPKVVSRQLLSDLYPYGDGGPSYEEWVAGEWQCCTYTEPLDHEAQNGRSFHISRHFQIKDKTGQVRRLNPIKRAQRKLSNLIFYLRRQGKPVRVLVLKSRKVGMSTWVEADMMCEVMERQVDGIVIAHDKPTAEYIFGICNRYYDRYDLPKPSLSRSNKKELKFLKHEGFIEVHTANKAEATRGRTPQYIHSSEVGFWEKGVEAATALMQAIPDVPGTTAIYETTANGYDPLFYPLWKKAEETSSLTFDENLIPTFTYDTKDWNGWVPLFISVLEDEDCERKIGDGTDREREQFRQTLDVYEKHLVEDRSATLEFINFRRHTINHRCQGQLEIWNSEYPETSQLAFVASGRPRFDRQKLSAMPREHGRMGRLVEENRNWQDKVIFVDDPQELLRIFRTPMPGHRYSIGVDTAEGLLPDGCKDPDASVMIVLDKDDGGRQVAIYAGQVSPENIVHPLWLLARYYNNAYLVIEKNSTGTVVTTKLPYPPYSYPHDRFFHDNSWDPESKRMGQIGFRTTVTTRQNMIGDLADCIRDRSVLLHDERTIGECNTFIWSKQGRFEAERGHHDDAVFALALAVQGLQFYPRFDSTNVVQQQQYFNSMRARQQTADAVTGY